MNRNLEQIRALHAHRFWDADWPNPAAARERLEKVTGQEGGNVVAKLGPLILECGLLATIAFAKNRKGYETLMKEVGRYLGSGRPDDRNLLPSQVNNLNAFIHVLTTNDSALLRQATAEALLYVGYLKRFAPRHQNSAAQAAGDQEVTHAG